MGGAALLVLAMASGSVYGVAHFEKSKHQPLVTSPVTTKLVTSKVTTPTLTPTTTITPTSVAPTTIPTKSSDTSRPSQTTSLASCNEDYSDEIAIENNSYTAGLAGQTAGVPDIQSSISSINSEIAQYNSDQDPSWLSSIASLTSGVNSEITNSNSMVSSQNDEINSDYQDFLYGFANVSHCSNPGPEHQLIPLLPAYTTGAVWIP